MSKAAVSPQRKTVARSKRKARQAMAFDPLFFGDWEKSWVSPRKRKAFIQQICDRIITVFQPEKIILFGSQAYGKPTPESDIDLLVVMPFEGRSAIGQAIHILKMLNLCLPLDLFVYTSQQLQERLNIGDRFIKEITDKGKLIYAAPNN